MSKRDEFITSMKSLLHEGKEELSKLESKALDVEGAVKDKYSVVIEELHEKRELAEAKLKEVELAGEDMLDDLKDDAEKVWSAFKASLDAFHDFTDHS